MKNLAIIFWAIILFPFIGNTQTIEDIDYISPFSDGVAAIKKATRWAFLNTEGDIVLKFRDDLVTTKTNEVKYPIFKNDRCLITKEKNGIIYFGYIDKSGKTILEPKFLNATNFNNGFAFALQLEKEDMGNNDILGKKVVSYNYYEVIINTKGEILNHLSRANHITLSEKHIKTPPEITSKFIADNLIATMNADKKWVISKIQ